MTMFMKFFLCLFKVLRLAQISSRKIREIKPLIGYGDLFQRNPLIYRPLNAARRKFFKDIKNTICIDI